MDSRSQENLEEVIFRSKRMKAVKRQLLDSHKFDDSEKIISVHLQKPDIVKETQINGKK